MVGSKLRAFRSLIVEQKNVLLIASVLGFGRRYSFFFLIAYLCSNRSESKIVIKYPGALPSRTFFKRPSLLSLNI